MTGQTSSLWAIVPAAGIGQRMQAESPKQYLQIHGRTILEHAVAPLLQHPAIRQVVVCVAEADTQWPSLPIFALPQVIKTLGGETRAQSVLNGLRTLAGIAQADDWVLVHDAARPCLAQKQLDKLISTLVDHPVGGILAVPAKDTLKKAGVDGVFIECTVNRETIWQAQTPQMFRFEILRQALQQALDQGLGVTDESSAVEMAGYTPMLVEGDASNIKLTRPEDLRMAEAILASDYNQMRYNQQ